MGQRARSAVGLAELPHGIPVEINGEFEIHCSWLRGRIAVGAIAHHAGRA